jgi:DNA topoisomerase-1
MTTVRTKPSRGKRQATDLPAELAAAREAKLRYVTDAMPGIRRVRAGRSYFYRDADGKPVRDPDELRRIRALVIPPAWTDVWICPIPNGHLQATGRDARGRKQYRYHPRWRQVRDESKYEHMLEFARVLPRIRERVERDLSRPGLPRDKVLAALVRLLETTYVRVGNDEYARENNSFGLTTMRDRHATIDGSTVRFKFVGKSGKQHDIDLHDRRLASVVKRCRDVPGQRLFQYVEDDGERRTVDSTDVNDYLREITGADVTAKDFRTWYGTVLAALALQELEAVDSTQVKQNVVQAIESVAQRLGNTPAICRKCYVHPEILNAYMDGDLLREFKELAQDVETSAQDLSDDEERVLTLLQKRLGTEMKRAEDGRRRRQPARH